MMLVLLLHSNAKLKKRLMKIPFTFFLVIICSAAQCEPLILYKTDDGQKKYLLCRNYQDPDKNSVSQLIAADTFAIKLDGAFCEIIMSNVVTYQTTIYNPQRSNEHIKQNKISTTELKMDFPRSTKLIFNNSIVELSQVNLNSTRQP
jgi:hypothetical protein